MQFEKLVSWNCKPGFVLFNIILRKGKISRRKEYDLLAEEKNRENWTFQVKTSVMTRVVSFLPLSPETFLSEKSENCETYVPTVMWLRWHDKLRSFQKCWRNNLHGGINIKLKVLFLSQERHSEFSQVFQCFCSGIKSQLYNSQWCFLSLRQ